MLPNRLYGINLPVLGCIDYHHDLTLIQTRFELNFLLLKKTSLITAFKFRNLKLFHMGVERLRNFTHH